MSINIPYIIITVLCFVPAIVFHEVAHGFAAYKLGDPTAKVAGRLTLNPIAHIDPFGTVILPLLLMLAGGPVFGYAKPVPYNPRFFKDIRKGDVIVGMAGPAANLAMAVIGAILAWCFWPFASDPQGTWLANDLFYYFYLGFLPNFTLINLYFMFFNLIPVPPLDGSSLVLLFLPKKYLPQWYRIQQYALPVLMIVLIVLPYVFNISPIGIYLDATAGNLGNLLFPFRIS